MNVRIWSILLGALALLACESDPQEIPAPERPYREQKLSFNDPCEPNYVNGKYRGPIYETCIRKPENFLMVHRTLRRFGYENLLGGSLEDEGPCLIWAYVDIPCGVLFDSLLITYQQEDLGSKYYREFWSRREHEDNAAATFLAIKEIVSDMSGGDIPLPDPSQTNDTLLGLLQISEVSDTPSLSLGLQHFDFLRSVGLHGSAEVLLKERNRYLNLSWNRDSLLGLLKKDSGDCFPHPWLMDDSK